MYVEMPVNDVVQRGRMMTWRFFCGVLMLSMIPAQLSSGDDDGSPGAAESLPRRCFEAAGRTADWMIANQIKDPYDGNYGRFNFTYKVADKAKGGYTPNWIQGVSIMGLLMMWRRTGEVSYLEAARRSGQHLMDLQILDPRNPEYLGGVREDTTHSPWCHPRDGLTGMLGLLWLYEATREQEYLERVNLFNKWFFKHAVKDGWPLWTFHFDGRPHVYLQGSFHGGDGLFFYDYWRITGDEALLDHGLRGIVDYAAEKFLSHDGKVRVIYDAEKGLHVEDGITFNGMQKMHRHNDDFMSISFLDAWVYYKDELYLKRAEAYAAWLISEQRPDGGFGNPDVPPAAPVAGNFLLELYRITKKETYAKAAARAAEYLLTTQEYNPSDSMAHGGFYGYGDDWSSGKKETLNMRTSAYALIFLLKMEGCETGPYYSPFNRDGALPSAQ